MLGNVSNPEHTGGRAQLVRARCCLSRAAGCASCTAARTSTAGILGSTIPGRCGTAPLGSRMSKQQLSLAPFDLPRAENVPDPRHHPIREFVKQIQRETGSPEQWDARSARALAKWFKANPTVTVADAQRFVRNRFGTDSCRGEPPWSWLPKLTMYCEGPLDRFNRPCLPDWRGGYEGMR